VPRRVALELRQGGVHAAGAAAASAAEHGGADSREATPARKRRRADAPAESGLSPGAVGTPEAVRPSAAAAAPPLHPRAAREASGGSDTSGAAGGGNGSSSGRRQKSRSSGGSGRSSSSAGSGGSSGGSGGGNSSSGPAGGLTLELLQVLVNSEMMEGLWSGLGAAQALALMTKVRAAARRALTEGQGWLVLVGIWAARGAGMTG
jgi:hypothetical protein